MAKNKKSKKQTQVKAKSHKALNIILPTIGGVALAGGIAALTVSLVRKSGDGEVTKEHEIVVDEAEIITQNYNVLSDKKTAKKGDTVRFTVTPKYNVLKVPKFLKINDSYYPLVKNSEGQYEVVVTIESIEKMIVTVVEEEIAETFTVTFMDNDTVLSEQPVVENGKAVQPKSPSKAGFVFEGWCSDKELNIPFNFEAPIIRNTIAYAKWSVLIEEGTVTGGSSLLQFKSDAEGSDSLTWILKTPSGTVESPTWTITDKAGNPIEGLSIANGKVSWKNVAANTYTAVIKAVKGDISATTEINIISTDHTYALSGGSTLLTAKTGAGGSDTNSWKLYQDGTSTTVTPTSWSIIETGETAAPTGVSIADGKVSWTAATPSGTYDLTVTATYDEIDYTASVSLAIADSTYVLSNTNESTSFNVKPTETTTDTNVWALTKDTSSVSTPNLKIENISPSLSTGSSITISSAYKLIFEKIPAGTYTFDVVAYDKINGTDVKVASTKCTVVSTASHVQYGDGTKSSTLTVKDTDITTDTNAFELYNGTTKETGVTWSVDTISPSTGSGSIAFDTTSTNCLKITKLPTGTYTMTIKATQNSVVVATMPFTVVSEDTKIALAISGESTLNFDSGLTSNYTVNTTRTVTWSIEDGYTTATKPSISADGKVTLANTEDPSGTFTIKAVDSTSGQTATKTVTVTKPEVNSSKVWTYDSTNNWSSVDMDSACGSSTISITPVGGTATTVARDAFNQKIVIGNKVTSIQDGFLNECTNFEQTITFADNSACLNIGDNFLLDCAKFNQTLSLPSAIQHIGSHFLDGCELFNNGNPSTSKFDLPSALETIGSDFLCGCTVFNLQLTIPSTVTFVGDNFMTYCNAMVSTLTINVADPSLVFFVPADPTQSYTCATDSSAAQCYTTGIPINGTGATEFMAMFTNRDTEPYRNLKASS